MIRIETNNGNKTVLFSDVKVGDCFYVPSLSYLGDDYFFIKSNVTHITEKRRNSFCLKDYSHWIIADHNECIVVDCVVKITK